MRTGREARKASRAFVSGSVCLGLVLAALWGAPVEAKLCPGCGKESADTANFCSACGRSVRDSRTGALPDSLQQIVKDLGDKGIGKEGTVASAEVFPVQAGLVIRLKDDLLFAQGSATLKPGAGGALDAIGAALKDTPQRIVINGYTDSTPLQRTRGIWKTNQALSAARAQAVLEALHDRGVADRRLKAVGHGEKDLMRDTHGDEDKGRSRRVEILIAEGAPAREAPPEAAPAPAPETTAH